jgi:hypothetical protein
LSGHIAEIDSSEKPPQVPRQVVGLLRSRACIEGHRAPEYVVERQQANVSVTRLGVGTAHGQNDLFRCFASKWRLAPPELHDEYGHGKNVGCRRQLTTFHLLGGHVPGRPKNAVTTRTRRHGRRDSEVNDFDLSFLVGHHVARRDVAVNDVPSSMGVIEGSAHFDADVGAFLR